MKKNKQEEPKCLYEVLEYEHKGIKIFVNIDHRAGKVSIVKEDTNDLFKEFVFASRGLEYMAGWQNILDALKYAIGEATKILEIDNNEKTKSLEGLLIKESKNIKYDEIKKA